MHKEAALAGPRFKNAAQAQIAAQELGSTFRALAGHFPECGLFESMHRQTDSEELVIKQLGERRSPQPHRGIVAERHLALDEMKDFVIERSWSSGQLGPSDQSFLDVPTALTALTIQLQRSSCMSRIARHKPSSDQIFSKALMC